jgi:multicomponent Na+:H+ antiporter subunit E
MKSLLSSASWILILLAAWLMLTAGNLPSLMIGLPFIALAILTKPVKPAAEKASGSHKLMINIVALFRYAYFFMLESLRGGLDVSRRVLLAETRVSPDFYDYPMQLQVPHAQQLFISSISLLPGTLCANRKENMLRIHTIDQQTDTSRAIKQLEALVGKIFGESL